MIISEKHALIFYFFIEKDNKINIIIIIIKININSFYNFFILFLIFNKKMVKFKKNQILKFVKVRKSHWKEKKLIK